MGQIFPVRTPMKPYSYVLKRNPFKELPFAAVLKYDPAQARDAKGMWTTSGAEGARSMVVVPVASKLMQGYSTNTTGQQILASFSPMTAHVLSLAKTKLANDVAQGLETNKYYSDGKGGYTPERVAVQKAIVKAMLLDPNGKPFPTKEHPTAIVLGGRGGSGKSQFDIQENPKIGVYDSHKMLVIDADKIKEELGKSGPIQYLGYNSALFHEESSHVVDMLQSAAKRAKMDMVLDATLKSDKTAKIKALIASGYNVEAHYMFLPPDDAAKRAVQRFMTKNQDGSGRLVPPEVVLSNKNNEKNFDKLIGLVNNWSVFRNDVARGEPPKLVAEKGA